MTVQMSDSQQGSKQVADVCVYVHILHQLSAQKMQNICTCRFLTWEGFINKECDCMEQGTISHIKDLRNVPCFESPISIK